MKFSYTVLRGGVLLVYHRKKGKLLAMLRSISINNYIGEDDIMDMEKFLYRKYFDWRILNFCLRNKANSNRLIGGFHWRASSKN